jgi:hypothetical protein
MVALRNSYKIWFGKLKGKYVDVGVNGVKILKGMTKE